MYRVAWRRRHNMNERAFFAYLQTKLGAETRAYIKSLEGRKPQAFHITNHFNERWFMEILKEAYIKFGSKQGEFLDRYQKKDENQDFYNAWILALLLLFKDLSQFIMILGIIKTIKVDIQRFVEEKIREGIEPEAIITLLSVYLTAKNIIRSQTIARTELTKIMNFASEQWAYIQGKQLKKKWIVTLDGKERASHNAMAGYPAIALNEKFIVGGSLMDRPGDASAPANELVNCRCGLMYVE